MATKTWLARVSFNTGHRKTDLNAYRWSIMRNREALPLGPTGHLTQTDTLVDGIVRYTGSFATYDEADRAIRAYIRGQ